MSTPEEQLEAEARAVEGEVITAAEQRGGADSEPGAGVSTADVLTQLLKPTFRLLAPNWEVTDDECAMLGSAYGAVVDKYFPDLDLGVELTAALVTLAVFGPRWGKPAKVPKPKPTEAAKAPAGVG
ncbi:MAG TPA: hypothetical protein VNO43_10105 [Candidatus Eisenbacteria bacterium]|nr:hypothetical protein [Candidatus Eisenbacteria bacterium]